MQNNIFNYYSYVFNDNVCIPNVYTLYENETAPRTATTITPASNAYNFWYMGIACKSSTSVSVQFEVTTAGGFTSTTSNYYEFLIFKGELATPLAQTSLTRLGSISTTADVSTTGIKTVNIPMTTPIGTAVIDRYAGPEAAPPLDDAPNAIHKSVPFGIFTGILQLVIPDPVKFAYARAVRVNDEAFGPRGKSGGPEKIPT